MAHGFTSETRSFEVQLYEAALRGEDKDKLDRGSLYANGILVGSHVYCIGSLQRSHNAPPFINVCKFDLTTNTCYTWRDPEGFPCGRGISLCLAGDALYAFGGAVSQGQYTHTTGLRKFDLVLHEWAEVETTDMPRPRAMCSGVLVGEKRFVVFGGYMNQQFFNDTWVFDIERRTWKEVAVKGRRPRARWTHEACVSEDYGTGEQTVYIFGGYNQELLADLHMLHCSRSKYRWSQPAMKGAIPPSLNGHRMMYFQGKILLCGGSTYQGYHFLSVYDVKERRWHAVRSMVGSVIRSITGALAGSERDADEYAVYGQYRLRGATVSEHAAIPCSKGILLVFGSSSTSALLVPR